MEVREERITEPLGIRGPEILDELGYDELAGGLFEGGGGGNGGHGKELGGGGGEGLHLELICRGNMIYAN